MVKRVVGDNPEEGGGRKRRGTEKTEDGKLVEGD